MSGIRATGVSKELAMRGAGGYTIADIAGIFRGQLKKGRTFRALDDVTFEVGTGEFLGVVGANGAGKTTLLKLICRIYEPTEGRIEVSGRVVPLLQIGAGFHFDLTGRDNIYVNAALLGIPRPRVRQLLDQIIDFSGIEKFIDTPVKYYSSGMYVRLAFAVAVHSDPSVVLTDEILAVGDLAFQAKCLARFKELRASGVSGLFVSHVPAMVMQFCERAIFLEKGSLKATGPTAEIVQQYIEAGKKSLEVHQGPVRVAAIEVSSRLGRDILGWNEPGEIAVELESDADEEDIAVDLGIFGMTHAAPITWSTSQVGQSHYRLVKGRHRFSWKLENIPIWPGTYYVQTRIRSGNSEILPWTSSRTVTVTSGEESMHSLLMHAQPGAVYLKHKWECGRK